MDADGDGFSVEEDCDDGDVAVNPDAAEVCNGVDDDCDGGVDLNPTDGATWYADRDGDGFGDDANTVVACAASAEFGLNSGGDCDDSSDVVYPGSTYVLCDGADNDCDSSTPDTEAGVWWEGEDGGWTDFTATLTGSPSAPTAATLNSGTLHVCDGTWYVNLTVTGAVAILGHGKEDAPVLDAAGKASVIAAPADGATLVVDGLTLRNGAGTVGSFGQSGGGIYAYGAGACSVTLTDSTIDLSTAYLGGAIYVDNCDLSVARSTLIDNSASYGGAVHAYVHGVPATLEFTDSILHANSAVSAGGGINLESYATVATVTLVDTFLEENTAGRGAGLYLAGDSASGSCTGTAAGKAGFRSNQASSPDESGLFKGGGAVVVDLANFVADNCDFGESETGDDNAPEDIRIPGYGDPELTYSFGDGASFTCGPEGCL